MSSLLMISGDRRLAAGGTGAFFETLKELSQHFERIDVICPRINSDTLVKSLLGNVYLHPARGNLFFQPLFIRRKGKELVRAHGHSVMTVHDYPPFYNGIGARILKRATGIPAVLEIHHLVGWPLAASFSEWIGRALSKAFLPSHCQAFSAVRVVNRTVKDQLAAWRVRTDNVHIVPSIYLDHAAVERARHAPKKYDFVFCARLVANKGLFPVLQALAHTSGTLLIVGDGPQRDAAKERVIAHGLEDRVTFTGWLPSHDDVLKAVASARIFIMNSTSEGGPRAAVEAMALGLPVLTTPVGLMPELVTHGQQGYLTDGTASDLALKAGQLMMDAAKTAEMGREAAAAAARFEKASAVGTYAEFLQNIAS